MPSRAGLQTPASPRLASPQARSADGRQPAELRGRTGGTAAARCRERPPPLGGARAPPPAQGRRRLWREVRRAPFSPVGSSGAARREGAAAGVEGCEGARGTYVAGEGLCRCRGARGEGRPPCKGGTLFSSPPVRVFCMCVCQTYTDAQRSAFRDL